MGGQGRCEPRIEVIVEMQLLKIKSEGVWSGRGKDEGVRVRSGDQG